MAIFAKLFRSKKQNDDEFVVCGKCIKKTKVEYFGSKSESGRQRITVRNKTNGGSATIIGPDEIKRMKNENIALRCTACGFVVCFSCASTNTSSAGMLTCPSCGEEEGPYIFTR